eukprot:347649-Chlamydomonas_euryale.AAC.2
MLEQAAAGLDADLCAGPQLIQQCATAEPAEQGFGCKRLMQLLHRNLQRSADTEPWMRMWI